MTGDGYVPVQLIKPDGMYYGWVRLIAFLEVALKAMVTSNCWKQLIKPVQMNL